MSDGAKAEFREARAVELKMASGTYQQIAEELGSRTRSGAWHAVDRALRRRSATIRAVSRAAAASRTHERLRSELRHS